MIAALLIVAGVYLASVAVGLVLVRRSRPTVDPDQAIEPFAGSYSPDVELDEQGLMVFTRDIAAGETFMVPLHMLATHRRNGGG